MTTPQSTIDEGLPIDELLKPLLKGVDFHNPYPVHVHGSPQFTYWTFDKAELEAALTTLIDEKVREAVITELELHSADWVEINEDGTINPGVVYDRLASLKGDKL